MIPYQRAICIVSVGALAIAGVVAILVGIIKMDADVQSQAWVSSHPATHPADGQWRWVGFLDKRGSARGRVYHMHDPVAGLRGIRASMSLDTAGHLHRRGDEPSQSGEDNGIHLDYVWKDDDLDLEHRLGQHHYLEHELDQAFAYTVSDRHDIAEQQGYFCADIVAVGSTPAATQGAMFVVQGQSYPYQPVQASAVVSACRRSG